MEKSTIYIDIEDDITAIIGKINEAAGKQVRLVVPKRTTVLQSVVNLKLIKKSAQASAKEAVLVTEDTAVIKLAARLDFKTAPNLNAEPAVPTVPDDKLVDLPSDLIEGEAVETGLPTPANGDKTAAIAAAGATVAATKPTKDASRKRIPDFGRFKKRFVLGMLGLAGIIFLGWLVLIGLPKAKVVIAGRTEPFKTEFGFTADTQAKQADFDNDVLPAASQDITKTLAKAFNATGKKDVGTKATGNVTIKNCEDTDARSLSAGTSFVAASGQRFVAGAAIQVPEGEFKNSGQTCVSETVSADVAAAENGSGYNVEPTSYTSSALPGSFVISGNQMVGGTSKVITVVTQGDADNARNEIIEAERAGAKKELAGQFDKDSYLIEASLIETVEQLTSNPGIDQEATNAQLTLKVKYTQMAVSRSELEELMKRNEAEEAKKHELTQSLGVVNVGLDKAEFAVTDRPSATATHFRVKTEALLGPDIDFAGLKQQIGGKKSGETAEIIKAYPNVNGVEVKLSPFWVRKVPRNPEKVIFEVKIPTD